VTVTDDALVQMIGELRRARKTTGPFIQDYASRMV
jgi:hypothetical protein